MSKLMEKNRDVPPDALWDAGIGSLFPFLSDTMIRRKMWPVVKRLPQEERDDLIEAVLIAANAKPKR